MKFEDITVCLEVSPSGCVAPEIVEVNCLTPALLKNPLKYYIFVLLPLDSCLAGTK